MEEQQKELENVEESQSVNSDHSTITEIKVEAIPASKRFAILAIFYSTKLIFSLTVIAISFIGLVLEKIDQGIFSGIILSVIAGYLLGKLDLNKILGRKK